MLLDIVTIVIRYMFLILKAFLNMKNQFLLFYTFVCACVSIEVFSNTSKNYLPLKHVFRNKYNTFLRILPSKNFTRVIIRKILKFLKLIREELMSLVYRMHFSQEYNASHFLTRICSNNARYLLLSQSLLAELLVQLVENF